jgi:pyruvate dehydrogenase E2 component (dihydrolipoamide acetyltransferase)
MAQPILMPKPGQMTEECTVVAWLKHEGDPVRRGDVLFEIETDKANMDVESFSDGVLLKIVAPEGQTVAVNSVCAWVGEPGEAVPDAPDTPSGPAAGPPPVAVAPAEPVPSRQASPAEPPTTPGRSPGMRISPRASRAAAELGIDPRVVTGTGPTGRITERDVRAHVARTDRPAATAPPSLPRPPAEGEEVQPLSRLRQVIARRLTESWTSTPHFAVTVPVDVTGIVELRAELRSLGETYSVTDFVVIATAQTLVEFPLVNSKTDGTSIWRRSRVNLGLAVSVEDGLLVPVIRDADRLTIRELHDRAVALADGARAGTLGPDDLTGGTFTVTNMGMYGIEQFSPIINPGEGAILAVASIAPAVVPVGGGIGVRQLMRLTLAADHRLVDGELGARFLNALRRRLEDIEAIRRDVGLA